MSITKIMRKISLAAVILSLLFQAAGYIFIHSQLRNEWRTKFRSEILKYPVDKLERLQFPREEDKAVTGMPVFIEENEFRFGDEIYDVVYVTYSADSVTYFCIKDTYEKSLIRQFIRQAEQNEGHSKNVAARNLLQFSLTLACPNQISLKFLIPSNSFFSNIPVPQELETTYQIVTPPPELL